MGSFIALDTQKLLNGELGVRESSGDKVAFLKLCKRFSIKLGLELFQDIREFYVIGFKSARAGYGDDHQQTKTQNRNKVARER